MHDRPHSFVSSYSRGDKWACELRDYMTFFCLPQKSSMPTPNTCVFFKEPGRRVADYIKKMSPD
jgi:hypothetical protein